MGFWILTGNEENWATALDSGNIWGVRKGNLVRYWKKLNKGDILLFYVISPISGLIGVGELESKFKQDKPLWPDEVREQKVIYPYRFNFKILAVISPEKWRSEFLSIKDLRVGIQAGVNPLSNIETLKEILVRVNEKWALDISIKAKPIKKKKIAPSKHNEIRDKLVEVGRMEGFISEKEYPLDGERLDVSWRRVVRGVPTKVFEVQIGGSIHQALAKLKHAFDLWNSEPFLIIDEKSKTKATQLLSGTFHELGPHIKVIPLSQVEKLYVSLMDTKILKKRFGLG